MFDNIEMLLKLLGGNSMNKLSIQNAEYIKQLNANIMSLDQNITTINTSIKELARDTSALQRAVIEYLREKDIIKTEDDVRLLQKLHMQQISYLDQEIAERREQSDTE
jgi:hypothetical protein